MCDGMQVSAATAKKKIANFSSKGEQFRKKYDELHQRQVWLEHPRCRMLLVGFISQLDLSLIILSH